MNFVRLIEKKRDGIELTGKEIRDFVLGVANGTIPDYQIAAFLMAVYFRGLSRSELTSLTLGMRDSGKTLRFPPDPRPVVDKHSTGGVGDKVSLPLVPLLACLGFRVPMISGRALGITGGTLDKLESIPGFRTSLQIDEIISIVQQIGCVICGQTEDMVPADKKLYSLRDVTGTVPSIPLIAASILSKKLAENPQALILDVKYGNGAFMKSKHEALRLARVMTKLASECGVKTRAILSNMNSPIGQAVGNWLEIKETMQFLNLKAQPSPSNPLFDLWTLVTHCAAHLLILAEKHKTLKNALKAVTDCMVSGKPKENWFQMLHAQGADIHAFETLLSKDHLAPVVIEIKSNKKGYVFKCDARIIGEAVRDLGGGRLVAGAEINHTVGIDNIAKVGQQVSPGDVIARIHAPDARIGSTIAEVVKTAFYISDAPPEPAPIIAQVI